MKRRIIYVWLMVVLILCNNMFAFATESEVIDYEDTSYEENVVEETTYPFQSFADKSITGVLVEGSVDEGVFPSGTTMSVMPVNTDIKEQIKTATNDYLNGMQEVVDLLAIDISFLNKEEKINPENGKTINIVVKSNNFVEGKDYKVCCFKDNNTIEIIPSTETFVTDTMSTDMSIIEEDNHKNGISFEIKEASIYAIVEVEDISSSSITETTQDEAYENEPSDNNKEEVDPSVTQDEAYETESFDSQDEEDEIETSSNQNEVETEQNETENIETPEKPKEVEPSETPTRENEEKSNTSTDQKDTKKTESPAKQKDEKETKNSAENAEKIKVSIEAKWEDCDDQDGIRPEDIIVYLLANGKNVDAISLTEKNQWKCTLENLPEYGLNQKITYTVEVSGIEGYETEIDGFTIKNSHKPATVSVEGKVIWEDDNNHDGLRPESVTIKLLANEEKVDETSATEKEGWKISFKNLPKYKSGKEIKYKVEQKKAKGYETKTNGFDVVNTHSPEKINIEGVKMWDDSNNKDRIRPESIKVRLIIDGIPSEYTTSASRDTGWKYSFESLPKYELGKEIAYTIEEEPVKGYTPKYYGYNITNKHEAGTVNKSDNNNNSNRTPKVGDDNNIVWWIGLIAVSVTIFLTLILFRRKK